jgi:hypothetical protein
MDTCSGDNSTAETESIVKQTINQMSIAKGKGLVTELQYDEIISQANSIILANERLKCIIDNIPKETVYLEEIIKEEQ